MTPGVEVFEPERYPQEAATRVRETFPARGVVVVTGGTTAREVYRPLAGMGIDWSGLDILFSDERCVPPDDDESNFRMVRETLLRGGSPPGLHRMRGEDPPERAAAAYDEEIRPVVEGGIDVMLLGMGADAHVGALFPGSPALGEQRRLCAAVERPDGLRGLTLTPPAMRRAGRVVLLVTGEAKAAAVRRVLRGNEPPDACPARLLDDLADVTFVLDRAAASQL